MRPAPAFDCANCGHRIGKTRGHNLTDDQRVVCSRCLDRRAHARLYPDCTVAWHAVQDHLGSVGGTRAGIAALLGVWP